MANSVFKSSGMLLELGKDEVKRLLHNDEPS